MTTARYPHMAKRYARMLRARRHLAAEPAPSSDADVLRYRAENARRGQQIDPALVEAQRLLDGGRCRLRFLDTGAA